MYRRKQRKTFAFRILIISVILIVGISLIVAHANESNNPKIYNQSSTLNSSGSSTNLTIGTHLNTLTSADNSTFKNALTTLGGIDSLFGIDSENTVTNTDFQYANNDLQAISVINTGKYTGSVSSNINSMLTDLTTAYNDLQQGYTDYNNSASADSLGDVDAAAEDNIDLDNMTQQAGTQIQNAQSILNQL